MNINFKIVRSFKVDVQQTKEPYFLSNFGFYMKP